MELKNVLPETIEEMHHAYLVEGNPQEIIRIGKEWLSSHSYPVDGNPDILEDVHDVFTIQEARRLKEVAYLKPVSQNYRIFFIGMGTVNEEAQNALLKIFEEPSPSSRFFLIVPRREAIIPTLASRLMSIGRFNDGQSIIDASEFVAAIPAKRIEMVQSLIEEKDVYNVGMFLSELERIYNKERKSEVCRELWQTVRILQSTTVSMKLVLENLALTLPMI